MVLRVILRCNIIADTACHWHGTQPGSTNQRINLLFAEQVEQLHKKDTTGNGQCKCKESTYYDTNGRPVQEGLTGHGGTHAQSKENSSSIHNTVGCRIKQTACIGTDFLNQITEHQHTNQRHCRGHKQGNNRSHCNREDNLQHTQVLYFSL